MRILLIDDHPLFREALASTVTHIGAEVAIRQYDTLAGVRAALAEDPVAALILLDLKLPDSQGMAGLLSLKAHFPTIPVAIISATDDPETILNAAACGAAGFISKAVAIDEMTAAIETLVRGETWFPESGAEAGQPAFSPTQLRILDGVRRGLMNKQIAWEVGLSEAAVKYHVTGIFRRMGVSTRAQLLALILPSPG